MNTSKRLPGSYGVEAVYLPIFQLVSAAVAVCAAVMLGGIWTLLWGVFAAFMLGNAALFFYTTFVGKFAVWRKILNQLDLHGDEQVLDVGCGRGLVLLSTAQYLTTGHATGLDLWQSEDPAGTSPMTAQRNAERVGVADKVSLVTSDMRRMPFERDSFDLVVASAAVHNLPTEQARLQAITEIVRVTKPGGRIAIVDVKDVRGFAKQLKAAGCEDVSIDQLGWQIWYGNPLQAGVLVAGQKKVHTCGGCGTDQPALHEHSSQA